MDNVTIIRIVAGLLFLGICLPLYFLPSILGRKKRNHVAIFAVNLLAGWTFIGWLAALIWALTNDSAQVVALQVPVAVPPAPALFCTGCGKYTAAGSKFCASCGHPF